MRFRASVLTVLAATLLAGGAAAQAAPKPLKALLVIGGCCHDYEKQKDILKRGIEDRTYIEVDIAYSPDKSTGTTFENYNDPDWAKGYDVVIHDECSADVKDVAYVNRILDAHRSGIPAVNLHCAMHCYRTGQDIWFKYLGLQSSGHGPQEPIAVRFSDPYHPIAQTLTNWTTIREEHYNNRKIFDTARPLAIGTQVINPKGNAVTNEYVVAWVNDYEGTRVFSTTLGHNNETVSDPRYLDLVTRGLLWSVGKLNDAYLKPAPKNEDFSDILQGKPGASAQPDLPDNLAAGKTATASSEETNKNNFASHAVDRSRDSRWCASSDAFPQWWQVDLGKPQTVRGVRITWEGNANYMYTVETSADGKEWKQRVDQTRNSTRTQVNSHTVNADGVRHLRVTVTGSGGGWASIREVEVFDKDLPEQQAASVDSTYLGGVKIDPRFEAKVFGYPPTINYPTFVKPTPAGVVFVSSDGNGSLGRDPHRGRILRCEDKNDDGVADVVIPFVNDVDSPRGLEWDGEWLYCLHPPHISAYRDTNGDGVADEERHVVENIGWTFADRPADHTSNGLTLGIDGWLYCAIGDFGFMEATGTDGRKLQLRGGGIVRVRTDGTGLELYTRGTRNIYEAGVSPLLDAFARDNTNDGGGWDVRLHHFTGAEEHGYPSLYINFNEEIIQPLADYGGGSGTGAHYLFEPGFPDNLNNQLYTVDWGRGTIYRHILEPYGATFKEVRELPFISGLRPTDIDADARGRMYVADWKNGRFNWDGPGVGFVMTLQKYGWQPTEVPDFRKASVAELSALLAHPSANVRKVAQMEIVRRAPKDLPVVAKLLADDSQPLDVRVAALFTLQLALGDAADNTFIALAKSDGPLRAFALRALANAAVPDAADKAHAGLLRDALRSDDPRVKREALLGLQRLGAREAAPAILAVTGDSDAVLAHTAAHVLMRLQAAEVCLDALGDSGKYNEGALFALESMHQPEVVNGLIAKLKSAANADLRRGILKTLARLYFEEGKWDGAGWGTRPDTTGPYYYRVTWSESDHVLAALKAAFADARTDKASLLREMSRNQVRLDDLVPSVIRMAGEDASLEQSAVMALLNEPSIPAGAVPLLTRIAGGADRNGDLRLAAAKALARSTDPQAFEVAFTTSARADAIDALPHSRNHLHDAVMASPALRGHLDWVYEQTNSQDNKSASLAWSALFDALRGNGVSKEQRASIEERLRAEEADPAGAVRILKAIAQEKAQSQAARVLASINHPDKGVRQAAQQAANRLQLDTSGLGGPKIAELQQADVIDQVLKTPGDHQLGEALFNRQSCVLCHTTSVDQAPKGPFLGNITTLYRRKEITEAILNPSATLAQGFAAYHFETTDGEAYEGFVTKESADSVTFRNTSGQEMTLTTKEIKSREKMLKSLMPEGLAANLTVKELASLVAYLEFLGKQQTP